MPRNSSSDSRVILLSLLLVVCLFGLTVMLAHPPVSRAAEFTVTSTADSGPGTLRQAILDASSGDTINFALPTNSVISLTSGQLEVNKSLTINGSGEFTVVRRTVGSFRVFFFAEGTTSSISRLAIQNGGSPGSPGGGILNRGTLVITECVIANNSAGSGGGLYTSGNAVVINSLIAGNGGGSGGGGAVFNSGTLSITGSTLMNNFAQTTGGAIFNEPNAIFLRLTNTTLSDNWTIDTSSGGSSVGGAIYTRGNMTLENCTVTDNTSSTGGGLYISPGANPDVYIRSSIIARNTGIFSGPDVSGENIISNGHILVGNNSGATITTAVGDQIGTAAAPIDPLLGPLQDNGGPLPGGNNFTHALLSGSPAIDRGFSGVSNTDQRGVARPVDSPVIANAVGGGNGSDIGAYEVQANLLPGCNTVNLVVNNNNDSGAGSLRDVMANACAGSTITFAPNVTGAITLTSGQLQITKSLTINGPGANLLAVQRSTVPGTPLFRIFLNNTANLITTISGLTIANGNSGIESSGGIYNGGTLTIINSTISGNSAGEAGAIRNDGTMTIISSTISGNSAASSSGGIRNTGTMTIINGTISGNSSAGAVGGGGIVSDGTSTITNSTISGNTATNATAGGGGLYAGGTVKLRNTIIALNTASAGPDVYGTVTSQGFNLIRNSTGANITSAQFTDLIGTNNSPVEPLLGPLQDNGGPTLTRALLAGSPAIDRGHASGSSTDQRGLPRPFDLPDGNAVSGDASDIGAFEAQVNCSYSINPTVQPFPVGGGTNFVSVTTPTGCAWISTSNSPFITITSGASGNGTGSVGYTVAANPDASQRFGVLIVAGQIFVVEQNGTTPTPTPTPSPGANTIQFSSSTYSVGEADNNATISVTRSGNSSAVATVDYAVTSNIGYVPCNNINGQAAQNCDYTFASGTVRFAANETSKQFVVIVNDDVYSEGNETLSLALSNSIGGTILSPSASTLTIVDNDSGAPASNPIDVAQYFVRQHYSDFLNRLPDAGGFAFWTLEITSCGSNQACIHARRVRVSNAFFYELEFQYTAAYVFRLYRAAYGNDQPFPNPYQDNLIEAKKIPLYDVFIRDRARVVDGPDLGVQQLALAESLAQRSQFLSRYPAGLTGAQFVDALLATIQTASGVSLASQRDALITLFNQSGRGAVLYRLADDNAQSNPINNRAFVDAEYSRSFVYGEYAGYLRRDADIGGFQFWLEQLNRFPLRDTSIQSALVCSFITSREYQERFSSVVTHSNSECGQ